MNSGKLFVGLSLSVASILSGPLCSAVYADDQPQTQAASQVPANSNELQDIVITAQRREERLSTVPISVQAITPEALDRAAIVSTTDLGAITPTVHYTTGSSVDQNSVVMRGISSVSFQGGIQPSTSVVVDGVPLGRQQEFISNLIDLDRIEVLTGPQGTLFGKNSTAGVINMIAKRPKFDAFSASVQTNLTTDSEQSIKGILNLPISDRFALRVNSFYDRVHPLTENVNPTAHLIYGSQADDNGLLTWGLDAKLLWKITDAAEFLVTANGSHTKSSFEANFIVIPSSGAFGDLQRQVWGIPLGRGVNLTNHDSPYYSKFNTYSLIGELNWDLADSLRLTSITGARYFKVWTVDDVDQGPTGVNPGFGFSPNPLNYPIQYPQIGEAHEPRGDRYWSNETRLNFSTSSLDLIGGTYYQDLKEFKPQFSVPFIFDGSYLGLTPGEKFYSAENYQSYLTDRTASAFLDGTYRFRPSWSAFAGVRYTNERLYLNYAQQNYFNPAAGFFDPITLINTAPPTTAFAFDGAKTTNNVSGRAGLQWRPTSSLNYYASFSRGYKGPAGNIGTSAVSLDSSLLKPEIATSYEIGAKQRFFQGRLSLDIALFTETVRDIQQQAVVPNSGIQTTLVNAGDLKTSGVEFSVRAALTDHLTIDGSASYNNAHYVGGYYACNNTQKPGVAPCTFDFNHDGIPETQSLTGQQAEGSPKTKAILNATYERALAGAWSGHSGYLRIGYEYVSAVQYVLGGNSDTEQPGYGLLNASIGITPDSERWELTLYGKNLTNKFYYTFANVADGFLARDFANVDRNFRRYGGLMLKVNL
jgi:iron complex outermembrane recepter protein